MSTPKWKAKFIYPSWITEDGRKFVYLRPNDNWSESTKFYLVSRLNVPKHEAYRFEIHPIPYADVVHRGTRLLKYFPNRYIVIKDQ